MQGRAKIAVCPDERKTISMSRRQLDDEECEKNRFHEQRREEQEALEKVQRFLIRRAHETLSINVP